MEITLKQVKLKTAEEKPCKVTLSVNFSPDLIKQRKEKVAAEFQRVAQLPGFRAGKAPIDLVRQNFSGKINSETLDQIFRDYVPEILKEKSLRPITTPMVDKVQFNGGDTLIFNLIIERNPDYKVKDYKKISLTKKTKTLTDADVTRELEELRERNAQLIPVQAEQAATEHFAVIDYVGEVEGKSLPELKAENQLVNLSSPQTIQGFAEGILGMKKAETKEVAVTFPKEYPGAAVAGKPVTFKITLQDIKEKKLPALDDEFAKDFEAASLEEFKTRIRESLNASLEKAQKVELETQMMDHLVKENEIPVPDSLVEMQLSSLLERAKDMMLRQGMKPDTDGKEAGLREKYRPQAERQVRVSYILSGIAKQENLAATDAEVGLELEKYKAKNPERAKDVEAYFAEHGDHVRAQMTDEKVVKFITENAKIKETA